MNKEQLKKALKPIISECVREVIMEGGLISSIISESIKGVMNSGVLVENTHQNTTKRSLPVSNDLEARVNEKLRLKENRTTETAKRILTKTGLPMKMFEGLEPTKEEKQPEPAITAINALDSGDRKSLALERSVKNPEVNALLESEGVDITGIMALAGGINAWRSKL